MAHPSWLSGSLWTTVAPAGDNPEYAVYTGRVDKPDLDDRDYRLIRLGNGMLVVLVHDANTDKAAASVHVAAGHMQDPDDVPGLAHFCEHMIMKGSKPYPVESDFFSYITTNGGVKNGVTGPADQDYYFSINPPALSGALDRLAAFFWGPLFTPSLTSREMNAVDSENKRNLQNDSRRIHQIVKWLSLDGHPWRKFGTGNVASLTKKAREIVDETGVDNDEGDGGAIGREVRKMLVDWWQKQYCAGRMTLAVVGKESLDELVNFVVPTFSQIKNRGLDPRPIFTDPLWGPEHFETIVFIKTVKEYHAFRLSFPTPDQIPLYQTRPAQFIAHFVGHEGPGSVCAFLKKKGWLVSLEAGYVQDNRSVPMFNVSGTLTKDGYLHYREVIIAIYNYLDMLRSSSFDPYHFNELAQMAKTRFRFLEKSQPHVYAREISRRLLHPVPPERILDHGALVQTWDEVAVRQLLDCLVPERSRVLLMAKEHDLRALKVDGSEEQVWEVEKWYGTEYLVKRLEDDLLEKARRPNDNPELSLPGQNPYIPENLQVNRVPVETPGTVPEKIAVSSRITLWYKKDDQFWVPKGRVKLLIRSPYARPTPRHAVMCRLYADIAEDALAEVAYDATLAGLQYDLSNTARGIEVTVGGYNDKLPVLLRTVLDKLMNAVIHQDRLNVLAEQLDRSYKNFYLGQPSNLTQHFVACVFDPFVWTPAEKVQEIRGITRDDLERYRENLFSQVHLETLVTGNISRDQALQIVDNVESQFAASRTLPSTQWHRHRSLILPVGADIVLEKTHPNAKEMNSAMTYYCHFGDLTDDRLRATLMFLVHVMKEPSFTQLRTVEQLGYVVNTALRCSTGSMGLDIKIQSLKAPSFLEGRVNAFLESFREVLAAFSPTKLHEEKNSLFMKLLEKPKNLGEEVFGFWAKISWEYYDFLQSEIDAKAIGTLDLDEIVKAYETFVLPRSPARRKLSMHLIAQQTTNEPLPSSTVISNDGEALFKAGLVCTAAAVPVHRRADGQPSIRSPQL